MQRVDTVRIIHGHQPQSLWLAGQAFREIVDASWQADGAPSKVLTHCPALSLSPGRLTWPWRTCARKCGPIKPNSATARSAQRRQITHAVWPNITPANEAGLPAKDCAQGLDKESNTCSNRGMEASVIDPFPSVSAALADARRLDDQDLCDAIHDAEMALRRHQAHTAVLTAELNARIQAMGYPLNGAAEELATMLA